MLIPISNAAAFLPSLCQGKGTKFKLCWFAPASPCILQPWAGRNPVLVGREKEKAVDWGNGEQRGARTSLHSGTVQPVLDVYYQHSFATVPSPVQHHKFAWSLRGCFWVPASTGQAGVVTVTWVLLSLSLVWRGCVTACRHSLTYALTIPTLFISQGMRN